MQPWTETGLRAATLDAARSLLVHEGYDNLSMRKIANTIGCSVSSLYLYFANKDQLVHALIDEGFERWYQIAREVAAKEEPPLARLESFCRRFVGFGLENPEFYEIMYMLNTERMARYPKELFRRASRAIDILTQLVLECAPEAFRGEPEARIHAHAIRAILHGVVATLLARRLDVRIDQSAYIDTSIRIALDSVRRPEPVSV